MQRIAMWSGPRNLSTAMMRSFENRADTCVVDEPLYAYYLTREPVVHPGREEIIALLDTDYARVTNYLCTQTPNDAPVDVPQSSQIFYQKHMAHHVFTDDDLSWVNHLKNVFLVREPAAMLASLIKALGEVGVEQTGLPQQVRMVSYLQSRGEEIAVIDSRRVLDDPRACLESLCRHLSVPFDENMLSWPSGPRRSDGVWAKYWYDSVNRSTQFERKISSPPATDTLPTELLEQCQDLYSQLLTHELN